MARPPLNVHQLELFYHVARCGGITAASRQMPYGIQQPAISIQMSALEAALDDTRLFHRRPFELTPAGRRLFDFVRGFFDHLDAVADEVARRTRTTLRLAAPATILRDHVPGLLIELRGKRPDVEITLHEANQRQCEQLLEKDEIDLAVCDLHGRPASGLKSEVVLELPLALIVPEHLFASGIPTVAELAQTRPLVAMPPNETLSRVFQDRLNRMGISWRTSIEVSSTELVRAYVAGGLGVGLAVGVPGQACPDGTKMLVLESFPRLVIAALWRDKLTPLAAQVLDRVGQMAADMGAKGGVRE